MREVVQDWPWSLKSVVGRTRRDQGMLFKRSYVSERGTVCVVHTKSCHSCCSKGKVDLESWSHGYKFLRDLAENQKFDSCQN